jgi:hypothetical protein
VTHPGGGSRLVAWSCAAALAIGSLAGAVSAQTLRPDRPRTLVVGTPAGGARVDRIDSARTGLARTALPGSALRVAWRVSIGALLEHAPLVASGGATYVIGTRGEVVALDEGGAEKWHAATGALLPGPGALLSDDTVTFVDGAGDAYAVREGSLRWKAHVGRSDAGRPSPLALDDGGLVAAAGRDLAALDAEGHERARATLPEAVAAPLVAYRNRVLAITSSGAVWSWAPGALEATRLGTFGTALDGGAALGDDHTLIGVTNAGARLTAVDLRDGASVTRASSAGSLWLGPPAAAGGLALLLSLTPSTEMALALDAAGREVGSALLQVRSPSVASDGGTAALVAVPRAAPVVDSSSTALFGTSGGALAAVARFGRAADATVELLPAVCSTLSPGVAASPISGVTPLGPGAVVVACRHGEVLSVTGTSRADGGDSTRQRLY